MPKNAHAAELPTKPAAISQPEEEDEDEEDEDEEEEAKTMRAWRRRGPKNARQSERSLRRPHEK